MFLPNTLTIGFIAHLTLHRNAAEKHIKAEVIESYRGGDIALGLGMSSLALAYYPFLQKLVGKTLIVFDGNNLLGATPIKQELRK